MYFGDKGKITFENALVNPFSDQMDNKKSDKSLQNLLNKKDIMQMFSCKDEKALKILKRMCSQNLAFRLNKEYYTTQENCERYVKLNMGRKAYV